MACNQITTYSDILQNLNDMMGATAPSPDQQRSARQATLSAYRELASVHEWVLYYAQGEVNTIAPYETGTIAYTHTGGGVPREVDLTGGVWPSWASAGVIRIGSFTYEVAARISDTVLQLSVNSNPGADVAALTAYVLTQDQYDMPPDFVSCDEIHTPLNWGGIEYVHPRDWKAERTLVATQAIPRFYTWIGSRRSFNTLCLALYPAPDAAYTLSFMYKRRPRPLVIDDYRAGTATATLDSTVVVGTGTAWTSKLVNTVMRFSSDKIDYPTGPNGANVATMERTVAAVQDATHLILDSAADQTLTNVYYVLSDPVDVEEGAMLTAFQRGTERALSMIREKKVIPLYDQLYKDALDRAMSGDSRTTVMRGVGWQHRRYLQLKNMPIGADQP